MTSNLAFVSQQAAKLPVLSVVVAGTGNVGTEFISLFQRQQQRLASRVNLQLAGVFNSRKALLAPGIDATEWQHSFANADHYQPADLLAYLAKLPAPKVLIDITPSQAFARQYPAFIAAGCHIISANKQGVTLPGPEYQGILSALEQQHLNWFSNTTVGAGIPVQRVLQELQQSGDHILQISGVFSGTLSWLLCSYDGSKPFSEFVLEAQSLGYTEPDPRDDLSGKDVQRKLLVLARELTLPLELTDITLEPLLPAGTELGSWDDFWQNRAILDQFILARYQQATAENKVLRYAATLNLQHAQVQAAVKLVAVSKSDPLAALAPCDNMFVIESHWYQQNPLVLKGPGAGRQVTAGGLHADLAVLAHHVELRSVVR
ncbi:aspartate kinase [Alishewanella sp. d11]|uniref:aspartate kinase n=1 Tax=Alishewanella sp. d11 TaxID=3414030 RepID=UPI003BF7796E